jgi:hypothetical protein
MAIVNTFVIYKSIKRLEGNFRLIELVSGEVRHKCVQRWQSHAELGKLAVIVWKCSNLISKPLESFRVLGNCQQGRSDTAIASALQGYGSWMRVVGMVGPMSYPVAQASLKGPYDGVVVWASKLCPKTLSLVFDFLQWPCKHTTFIHVSGQRKYSRCQSNASLQRVVIRGCYVGLTMRGVLVMLEFLMSLNHKFLTLHVKT